MALLAATECNAISSDKLHYYVSCSRMQEIYFNMAKAYMEVNK